MRSLLVLCLAATAVSAVWEDNTNTLSAKSDQIPIKYATLSAQRSGSGWFRSMLVSHPHVMDQREVFGKDFGFFRHLAESCMPSMSEDSREHAQAFLKKTVDIPDNSTDVVKYWKPAADLVSHFNDGTFEVTGFKWMMNQGLYQVVPEAVEYFNKENFKVIVLERKNFLRQAISVYQLQQTPQGSAHLKHADKSIMNLKLPITSDQFVHFFQSHESFSQHYDTIEATGNDVIRISYEQLMAEPEETIQKVYEFLGIDSLPVSTGQYVKTHSGPVGDYVEDWENVREELMKTKYANKVKLWEQHLAESIEEIAEEEGTFLFEGCF